MALLTHAYWIALLPLLVSVIVLLFGEEGPHSGMPYLSTAAMGWCLIHSLILFFAAINGSKAFPYAAQYTWFQVGEYPIMMGILIDGAAAAMLMVVSLVGFLVQLYSLGYMHGDPRLKRFYAYLSFFTASMLGLVMTSNLFIFFSCWEFMGLASYLLIGFWFEKPGPAFASKKAFVTTKMGDLCFYLGLLLLFAQCGTFDLVMLKQRVAMGASFLSMGTATAIGFLFLGGAIGKSAQVPLFIWLPDAMEGPTPVSALIHAATMVAAGIYLVARTYFIYQAAPVAMETVAWIGLLTAFMAATMALVTYDIKRVLAFSTVSQLGYMLLALGVGGYTAGMFHLTTHAFFKALLFLGAGSVIHAVHSNDMRQMGGLSRQMPATFVTMLVATAAIAGIPPFAGYFSKEAILSAVYHHNSQMWFFAVLTAGITTFYMFRMMLLTFWGQSRDSQRTLHAHESPTIMTLPLWILAVLALVSGFLLEFHGSFASLLLGHAEAAKHAARHPWFLLPGALGAVAVGFGLSWALYAGPDMAMADAIKSRMMPIFRVLENRYGFDNFFFGLARMGDKLAKAAFWFDDRIIDRVFVDGWGLLTLLVAEINNFIDVVVVDGFVDSMGTISSFLGRVLRSFVRGQVQEYLLYMAFAVLLFFAHHWIVQ